MSARRGRPADGEGPQVNWENVEEVLRKGELRRQPDGTYVHVVVSAREMARRVGVSHTIVNRFARRRGIDLEAVRRAGGATAARGGSRRRPGRPARDDAAIDWDAVEQRLLLGDLRRGANGREVYVVPSCDDLAAELGVSATRVRQVARERRVRERRDEALAAVPVRVPADDVAGMLGGAIQAGPYPERMTRIANLYAAQYEEDLVAGGIRRGEASVLERLIRTDMQIQEARRPAQADLLEEVVRQLKARLPAMRAARELGPDDGELSGVVIDATSREVEMVPEIEVEARAAAVGPAGTDGPEGV